MVLIYWEQRTWDLFSKIDRDKFNKLNPADRDFFFRSLYDMDSGGILANKGGKPLSAEETTLAICKYVLEDLGCLRSTRHKQ